MACSKLKDGLFHFSYLGEYRIVRSRKKYQWDGMIKKNHRSL